MKGIIAAEGVATNQLGEVASRVSWRRRDRSHFPQHYGHTSPGQLIGAFAAGQTPTDNVDIRSHVRLIIGGDGSIYLLLRRRRPLGFLPRSLRIRTASSRSSFSGVIPLGNDALSSPLVR